MPSAIECVRSRSFPLVVAAPSPWGGGSLFPTLALALTGDRDDESAICLCYLAACAAEDGDGMSISGSKLPPPLATR